MRCSYSKRKRSRNRVSFPMNLLVLIALLGTLSGLGDLAAATKPEQSVGGSGYLQPLFQEAGREAILDRLDRPDIVSIAAAANNSYLLLRDRSLWAWGEDWRYPGVADPEADQLQGQAEPRCIFREVAEYRVCGDTVWVRTEQGCLWSLNREGARFCLHGVRRFGIGERFALAQKADGRLFRLTDSGATELKEFASLGIRPDQLHILQPTAAGSYLVYGEQNELVSWSAGLRPLHSELIDGEDGELALRNVRALAVHANLQALLQEDGSLWLWGPNRSGEVGNESLDEVLEPVRVAEGIAKVDQGFDLLYNDAHTLALDKEGTLWSWGSNSMGQLANGQAENRLKPRAVVREVADMAAGSRHTLVLTEQGSLWGWGGNDHGQLGAKTWQDESQPRRVLEDVYRIKAVAAEGFRAHGSTFEGSGRSFALQEDGRLWAWGYNNFGQLGDGTKATRPQPQRVMDEVRKVDTAGGFSLFLKEDGGLWGSGYNRFAQLADYDPSDVLAPRLLLDEVEDMAAGTFHVLALREDGSVWSWGNHSVGQLGYSEAVERQPSGAPEPLPVYGLTNIVAVAAGHSQSLALQEDGTLWSWGTNTPEADQLSAYGTLWTDRPRPVLTDVQSMAAGGVKEGSGGFALAVLTNGQLWGWGDDELGQLALPPQEDKLQPRLIMEGVTQVAAAEFEALAVKEDGSLWIWGNGQFQPQRIEAEGFDPIRAADLASFHYLAVAEDGSLWTWGDNQTGQLGNGRWLGNSDPVEIDLASLSR